ncbi:hypothetical protein J6590_066806 [Homalodisca vitripennis]|nr:hypothetical protein J6590_066806 [Homalodisca vitripennis]
MRLMARRDVEKKSTDEQMLLPSRINHIGWDYVGDSSWRHDSARTNAAALFLWGCETGSFQFMSLYRKEISATLRLHSRLRRPYAADSSSTETSKYLIPERHPGNRTKRLCTDWSCLICPSSVLNIRAAAPVLSPCLTVRMMKPNDLEALEQMWLMWEPNSNDESIKTPRSLITSHLSTRVVSVVHFGVFYLRSGRLRYDT